MREKRGTMRAAGAAAAPASVLVGIDQVKTVRVMELESSSKQKAASE